MELCAGYRRAAHLVDARVRRRNGVVVEAQVHEHCHEVTVLGVNLIPPQLPCAHLLACSAAQILALQTAGII